MLRKRAQLAVLCLSALTILAANDSLADSDAALLEFILTANEQSVEKIKSISYTFSYDITVASSPNFKHVPEPSGRKVASPAGTTGPTHINGNSKVIQQGNSRWNSYQESTTWVDTGAKQDRSYRSTVNDDYSAFWPVGNAYAYQNDHESTASISPRARESLSLAGGPNPLQYAFGSSTSALREVYDRTKDDTRWNVRQVSSHDGKRKLFYVERFPLGDSDPSKPSVVQVIDPDKGFLISRAVTRYPSGAVKREYDNVLTKVAEGIWVPTQVQEKVYQDTGQGPKDSATIKESRRFAISNIEANKAIDESAFALKSLGIGPGVILLRRTLEGKLVELIHIDGKFVPLDLYRTMQKEMAEMDARVTESLTGPVISEADSNATVGTSDDHRTAAKSPSGGAADHGAALPNSRPWYRSWSLGAIVLVGFAGVAILLAANARSTRRKGGHMNKRSAP